MSDKGIHILFYLIRHREGALCSLTVRHALPVSQRRGAGLCHGCMLDLPPPPQPCAISTVDGQQTRTPQNFDSVLFFPRQPGQAAVRVIHGGHSSILSPHIVKTGSLPPGEGVPVSLNAALAASGASWLYIRGGFVTTKAVAAPGICASGVGTRLLVNGSAIHTWEDASPGMVIGEDAQAFTSQLSISTQGEGSPAMQVEGAGSLWRGWYTQATTAAPSSPALLCRDSSVFLYAARLEAWQSPALVVETGAKVTLLQAQLSGNSPAALYLRSPWNAGAPPVPVRIQLTGSQIRPSRQSPAILVFHTQADIVLQQSSLEGDIYVGPQGSAQVTLGSGSLWRGQFQGPGKGTLQQRQGGRWVRPAVSSE